MKKLQQDLLVVLLVLIFMLLLWSFVPTTKLAIGVLIAILIFILCMNIFFVLNRQASNIIERLFYSCFVFITASLVFTRLFIDDVGYYGGLIFLSVHVVLLILFGLMYGKQVLIKKYSIKTQNIIVFFISVIFTMLSFIVISF